MDPYTIEHSGKVWTALGFSKRGTPIWPIEEFFARRPDLTAREKREFRNLYPDGKEEGELPKFPLCFAKRMQRRT